MLLLHKFQLAHANAMLAGTGAAQGQCALGHTVGNLHCSSVF